MLPDYEDDDYEQEELRPSNTCRVDFSNDRLMGTVDNLEAVKQAVFVILNTERYEYIIHSWDFGIEIQDLIGQDMDYVESEVERRVTEALLQDDRIDSVENFEFERNRNKLTATFSVNCNFGTFESEYEVEV